MEKKISLDLSLIIPLMNEEHSLVELHNQITQVMKNLDKNYEVIFIDDGSTDQSFKVLLDIYEKDKQHVNIIKFKTNFGKASALQAGFQQAKGKIFITMDADLQDCPHEITNFLKELEQGVDMVSGWKRKRHDPMSKTLPSKLFNWATRKISGLSLHDFNCGFKAYRREIFKDVSVYGELHRYIPVLAHWKGYTVAEIIVEHRPRAHGQSKYGAGRMIKGLFDLATIMITQKYRTRPLHVFGTIGLLSAILGIMALAYLSCLWLMGLGPIGHRPLLTFGMLAFLFGGQLVSFGLLAEIITKYFNSNQSNFVVEKRCQMVQVELELNTIDE